MNHIIDSDTGKHPFSPCYLGTKKYRCFKCYEKLDESELIYLEKREGLLSGDEYYCEKCLAENQFYI